MTPQEQERQRIRRALSMLGDGEMGGSETKVGIVGGKEKKPDKRKISGWTAHKM